MTGARGVSGAMGEEAIIQGAFAPLSAGFPGALSLHDDAAIVAVPAGHTLVVTMDAIAEGVHFFADDAAADIGWKALAVNVSDLVAKGAAPHAYLMSLAFPGAPDREWIARFADGLRSAQNTYGLHLIGGDTDHRPGPLSITITAMGLVPAGAMVKRGCARAGDHIFVSNTLGTAALGLKLRANAPDANAWPLEDHERVALIRRYLRPTPPLGLIPVLRAHARAAMDISDGLMKDLGRMAQLSGVGAEILADRLPLSVPVAKVLAADPGVIAAIVAGGDDYEVLAAVAPDEVAAFEDAAARALVAVTQIGRIVERSGVLLTGADGVPVQLTQLGYDHF